ncbi:MAG: hypothetical protein ACKOJF_22565, partial [Planctomycetaceae bacterium]
MSAAPTLRQLPNSAPPTNPSLSPVPADQAEASPIPGNTAPLGAARRIDESVRCEFHARLISSLDLSKIG